MNRPGDSDRLLKTSSFRVEADSLQRLEEIAQERRSESEQCRSQIP